MAIAELDIIKLEDKLKKIIGNSNNDNFLFEFLGLYDIPKTSITKLKTGTINLSEAPGEYHLKNKLFFKESHGDPINDYAKLIKNIDNASSKPRYIFVTDYETILAQDTKTKESLDIEYKDLPQYFDFFLAWNGIEKADLEKENPLDIKAAERFARLYEVLDKINNDENRHHLNLFLTRVIFCLFAEDTGIFEKKSFTNGLKQYTKQDGSNINEYIVGLFRSLDVEDRENAPTIYKTFPYVNGKLFKESHQNIKFNSKAWDLLIECGELLNWSEINPDIFGSMIQTISSKETRGNLGMHYTSVSNIVKVIKPLFLDNLYDELNKNYNNLDRLHKLYSRIGNIKFFDPACGSGNFLIITYKELRKFEMEVFERINYLSDGDMLYIPMVTLDQFYGIEIDEFASEVAQVSLWIADHQMNMELEEEHFELRPTLPLKNAGDVRHGNSLRIDWRSFCPRKRDDEVYIFGNPPYLGAKLQSSEQKSDMDYVFGNYKYKRKLDYISAWFYLGSLYIKGSNSELAFVSTNSINQGEQVSYLWSKLLQSSRISFANSSFKWINNAKSNAVVFVVIIGLVSKERQIIRKLYKNNTVQTVENINPYLTSGETILVESSRETLNSLPELSFGNMPRDGGYLVLDQQEYVEIIDEYPELAPVIRRYIGSRELINNTYRYCLWFETIEDYKKVRENPIIKRRIEQVEENRLQSKAVSTRRAAEIPYLFVQRSKYDNAVSKVESIHNSVNLVIPSVSSGKREYIPMDIKSMDNIISNLCMVVYDAPLWLFGLLSSKMHMTWVKSVAGRMGTDYRYSAGLCYNTFPLPSINDEQKNKLTELALNILDIRDEEGKALVTLYNTDMPIKLKKSHEKLDLAVDQIYQKKPFNDELERLSHLLEMYKDITN